MNGAPLLSISRLSAAYGGSQALRDVSLTVTAGEVVGLLGANGAGKSTLLRAVLGLGADTDGEVSLNGRSLARLPTEARVRAGIGFVPEGRRVFPGLSVWENLDVAARGSATERDADAARVFTLFPELVDKRTVAAWRLSGGQQQMLAVGRALMGRPSLLLLDEPTLGLAPTVAARVLSAVGEIAGDGVAVLVAEQNAVRLPDAAMRVATLARGAVIHDGDRAAGERALRGLFG